MKTTIDIANNLLEEARKLAAREGKTVKALVEEGLRKVLADRERGPGFRLRKATFKGEGLQPDAAGASWERLREMAYGERGG
ncbi:MAG: type II toxin-antitoxin system VapB family antitoxin [Thermodesulfobacteriota bacterium]